MRKVGAILLLPLFIVGLVLTGLAAACMYTWVGVAFNKKQRRDMAVAGAIRTFVKAGGEVKKEEEKSNGEEKQEG